MSSGSRQIAVYVPADAHAACERAARARGMSMSDLVRRAISRDVPGVKFVDMRPRAPRRARQARGKEARR